jgi:thiamine pyrophosphate-dependent acetolactate synthase large subunit-like protein
MTEAPLKVHQALAEAVRAEGVDTMFGLMGDANMALWSEIQLRGIAQIHSARNEAGAVAMADGYFRATGQPGVATVTCGPGLTQIGTSLVAAARNRSALVLLTGEWPAESPNDLQCFDQRRFIESCEAGYVEATDGVHLPRQIASAFREARLRRRPVVLCIGNAVQARDYAHPWSYRPSANDIPGPLSPAPEDVVRLVDALHTTERPILLAGRGARRAGARDAVLRLADQCGALLGTTLQVNGMFADTPWSIGLIGGYGSALTAEICAEADLIVGIGARIGHYTSWGNSLFPNARVIRIDDVESPAGVPLTPGTHIRGDACLTIDAVSDSFGASKIGFRTFATQARLVRPKPSVVAQPDNGLEPRETARRLSALLTPNSRLTCGVGHFQGFVVNYMMLPEDIEVEYSSAFGAVGQTLPIALGIGLATKPRRHLVIEGDGSLMMNIQELDLAASCGLPTILAIWNDGGYGAEAQRLPLSGYPTGSATWTSPDFGAIARAYGGQGVTVRTPDDLRAAIAEAETAKGLYLMDLRVSPSIMSETYAKNFTGAANTVPFMP